MLSDSGKESLGVSSEIGGVSFVGKKDLPRLNHQSSWFGEEGMIWSWSNLDC